ncbi:MAG TPA: glycosyltransferase [Methylotenera sp.]|nr:glycosyltransferase [Methylotenera sp.]
MATFDVLLPVKNGIAYFAEALDSICNQTFQDWRLLVLDHGSTDGSFELATEYAARDPRVVVKSFPEAKGLSGLLNCGLEICDCQYVLRQDADDISMPNRMEEIAKAFAEDDDLVLVGSLGEVIDGDGKRIGSFNVPADEHAIRAMALFRTPVMHPTVAMRLPEIRKLKARYGVDFLQILPTHQQIEVPGLAEDYFLFGQLALVCKCENIQQELIQYRWHGANVSATKYVEQSNVALNISRNFIQTLSLIHDVQAFDPAPFCNHGEKLIRFPARSDFSREYQLLKIMLGKLIPDAKLRQREMAYRWVISNRSIPIMLSRYFGFVLKHQLSNNEWRSIRAWIVDTLKNRSTLTINANGILEG